MGRPVNKALHVLFTAVVMPYAALAVGFLIIGQVASTRGLWEILDTFLVSVNRVLSWGGFVFILAFLAIAALGVFERHFRMASLVLAMAAGASLAILVLLGSGPMEIGHWLFLAPCLVALVVSIGQVVRRT